MGGVRKSGGADRTTIADLALGAELQPEVSDSSTAGDAAETDEELSGGFDPLGAALQAQEAIRRAKESTEPSEKTSDGEVDSEAGADNVDGGTPWDEEETPWDEPDGGEPSLGAAPVQDSPESASSPGDGAETASQESRNPVPSSEEQAPASPKQALSPRTLSKAVRSMLWTGISKGELVHRELAAADDSPGNKVMCRTADVKAYMATRSKLSFTFEDMDNAVRQGLVDGVLVVGVCYQILRDAPRSGA